jgi:quinol monooxygenase YgiN
MATKSAARMTVSWKVKAGEAGSIATALQTLMNRIHNERGCEACSVSTEMAAQPRIDYVEEWTSELELQSHIRSEQFANLAELMEHSIERPDVTFYLPGGTRGIDYAEEVRRSSAPLRRC